MVRNILLVVATLAVSAPAFAGEKGGKEKKTVLLLKVAPDDTEVYVDGHKKGAADKVKELELTPGAHIVRLVHKLDEHEDQVVLKKGAKTTFEWKFEDDRPKPAQPEGDDAQPAPGGETEAPK